MTRAAPQTWLEKLEEQLNVDVDWMDPTYSKNLPIKPNDQTSNNLWVNQQMSHPENKEMVLQVCKELKYEGWKAAYTRIVRFPPKSTASSERKRERERERERKMSIDTPHLRP